MRDDGTLERLTTLILKVAQPATQGLDDDEALFVMLSAAALTYMQKTGCGFDEAYGRLRDLADALSVGDELN